MPDTKQRLLNLIRGLSIDELLKNKLISRVASEGATLEIVDEVEKAIQEAVGVYKQTVEEYVKRAKQELEGSLDQLDSQLEELDAETMLQYRDELKKEDEAKLAEIRKQLNSIN